MHGKTKVKVYGEEERNLMASASTVTGHSSTSKFKYPKRPKGDEGEDKLSKLAESVIIHILSFLPTKDAVRTSVLSKKWIHHWTSLTKLDINDTVFFSPKKKTGGKQLFINFVNRVLLLNKTSTREGVSLVITNKYDVSLVNMWISSILMQSLKYLHVDIRFELTFSNLTSHALFNCFRLTEMVLKLCCCAIRVPEGFIYFGQLKLMKLSGITFTFDSYSVSKLHFPVLKRFETINCTWLSAYGVTLHAPLLEIVKVQQYTESESPGPVSCAIKFSTSHLKEINYCGYVDYLPESIILLEPSSARNASLDIDLERWQWVDRVPETGSPVCQLFKQFRHIKSLKFKGTEVLSEIKVADLPLFGNLSSLKLGSITGELLFGFLAKSPVLNTLVFKRISELDKEFLDSAIVPDCLRSTLKVVKFGLVNGREEEVNLAKFLIENGLVLQRLSFSHSGFRRIYQSKAVEEFKEKIFSFKKGFSSGIVEFSHYYY
ncbi:hypothetical protein RJT34_29338 [Clitoria ternatea]|uniref:F-box domain-containing protein n=1 Tax=Clitoria ternatea TaxID=43366 RepID=A0AAN9ID34_CLITE